MTVLITLTTAGANSGPFDLYSNLDNYTLAFAVNVPQASLVAGYTSTVVPDYTTIVRVKSKGACVNYTDIVLTNTTTTTTTIATVPCNATTSSGGAGVTEAGVGLSPFGGVIIFEFNAQGVPDKMEFIHNGIKKSTSGMTVANSGPFENVYGDPTVPTNTVSIDQFIGTNSTIAGGVIPTRNSAFLTDTGITGITVEAGFQQLVWWKYTDVDYTINNVLTVRITGPSGTSWNMKRLCTPTTTSSTTLPPGSVYILQLCNSSTLYYAPMDYSFAVGEIVYFIPNTFIATNCGTVMGTTVLPATANLVGTKPTGGCGDAGCG